VKTVKVVFIGQPNVGKSSLFNLVTKSHVEVGNWPGKTVVVHKGEITYGSYQLILYDLPGIYGFSTLTQEEIVAREAILAEKPDVIIVVADSTIPERTMSILIQVLELTGRVVLVFSKTDLTHSKGIHIDYRGIEKELGIPVVPVSIASDMEIEDLLKAIIDVAEGRKGRREPLRIDYNGLNEYIDSIEDVLLEAGLPIDLPSRWISIRLIEGDKILEEQVKAVIGPAMWSRIEDTVREAHRLLGDPAAKITEARFKLISEISSRHIAKVKIKHGSTVSIFYRPLLGTIISIGIYLLVFTLVFTINTGFPLNIIFSALGLDSIALLLEEYSFSSLVEKAFTFVTSLMQPLSSSNPILYGFIANGILGGVASILVFLPLILLMVLIQVIIEDSGLMSRLAVSSHAFLSRLGLSGHAFFSFMLGFGCNVPAILSTRTNPNSLERLRLILTLSFIPCQARLVILLAFTSATTRFSMGLLIALSYITAIIVFMSVNYLLYRFSSMDKKEPQLLIEIPAYHRPLARVVYWKTIATVKHFVKKAGSIIFTGSIIIWLLASFTPTLSYTDNIGESIAAVVSKNMQFITIPLGITGESAWIISMAIITGFIAKELVVSTILVATGCETMSSAMRLLGLNDLQLLSLTVFTTLYIPCLATVSAVYEETKSIKLAFSVLLLTSSTAYIVASMLYHIASLFIGFH